MKALILFVTLFSVSLSAQAFGPTDCVDDVYNAAKSTLDLKAKKYAFSESSIDKSTIKKVSSSADGLAYYSMTGYIYKATYNVVVGLDASCSIDSVLIKEIL